MTNSEFSRIIKAAGMEDRPAIPACRLVLVRGYSLPRAERETGINRGSISRTLKQLPDSVCECCGGPIYSH